MINPFEPPDDIEEEPQEETSQKRDEAACALCGDRFLEESRRMYDHTWCFECANSFTRKRQFAYLIDLAIYWLLLLLGFASAAVVSNLAIRQVLTIYLVGTLLAYVGCTVLFYCKDGFTGQSPGKKWFGLTVVDRWTGNPIGPIQSLKRSIGFIVSHALVILWVMAFYPPNEIGLFLMGGLSSGLVALGFLSHIVTLGIATGINWGYRLGDDFAQTKVIWNKYRDHWVFQPNNAQRQQPN